MAISEPRHIVPFSHFHTSVSHLLPLLLLSSWTSIENHHGARLGQVENTGTQRPDLCDSGRWIGQDGRQKTRLPTSNYRRANIGVIDCHIRRVKLQIDAVRLDSKSFILPSYYRSRADKMSSFAFYTQSRITQSSANHHSWAPKRCSSLSSPRLQLPCLKSTITSTSPTRHISLTLTLGARI